MASGTDGVLSILPVVDEGRVSVDDGLLGELKRGREAGQ